MAALAALRLRPRYQARVWGGVRLTPSQSAGEPIGEAWLVHEANTVEGCPAGDVTLAVLAERHGAALLGRRAVARTGHRFPLLVKLLDTADWLSLQVHPDDTQAVRLAGPGHFGKTEAWHFLDVDPAARVIAGLRPGTTAAALDRAVHQGGLLDLAQFESVAARDTILIPAGTVHALGPGVFLYEVQQMSDLTYRVWDWDRPPAAGRALHLPECLACIDPDSRGRREARRPAVPRATLTECAYFRLDLVCADAAPVALDPAGESCHVLTLISGAAWAAGPAWEERLRPYDTIVIPAACNPYTLHPDPACRALVAEVP